MSAPKVKPLVWKAAPYDDELTATDHYAVYRGSWLYIIRQRSHGVYLYGGDARPAGCIYPPLDMSFAGIEFPTLEAAQAAAQAEWEAFVLSTLEP